MLPNMNRLGVLLLFPCLLVGCASLPRATEDERGVRYTIETWAIGMTAQDADTLLSAYSDDFTHMGKGGKAWMRETTENALRADALRGARVSLDRLQIVIDGATATASGVLLSSPAMDSQEYRFTLRREREGVWRITGMDTSGG
jgi:ketosteroid isomerase-like protein